MQYLSIGGLPNIQISLSEKDEKGIILRREQIKDLGLIVNSAFSILVATNKARIMAYTILALLRSIEKGLGESLAQDCRA